LQDKTTSLITFINSKTNKKGIIKKVEARPLINEIRALGEVLAGVWLAKDDLAVQVTKQAAIIKELQGQAGRDQREIKKFQDSVLNLANALAMEKEKVKVWEQVPDRKAMKRLREKVYFLENRIKNRFENSKKFEYFMELMLSMYESLVEPISCKVPKDQLNLENKPGGSDGQDKKKTDKLPAV